MRFGRRSMPDLSKPESVPCRCWSGGREAQHGMVSRQRRSVDVIHGERRTWDQPGTAPLETRLDSKRIGALVAVRTRWVERRSRPPPSCGPKGSRNSCFGARSLKPGGGTQVLVILLIISAAVLITLVACTRTAMIRDRGTIASPASTAQAATVASDQLRTAPTSRSGSWAPWWSVWVSSS